MSVNEVKLKSASRAFEIRGTGPKTSRTFAIGDEDHTIGNSLRHVLIQNQKVGFAGYSVPHPSEPIVQIRVQANPPTTAVQALQEACETLSEQCNIVLAKLEEILPEVKQDSVDLEKLKAQMEEEDDEEDEMEEDEGEDMEDEVIEE